jgi:prepilin-type processing-associated H-X9-DG protein
MIANDPQGGIFVGASGPLPAAYAKRPAQYPWPKYEAFWPWFVHILPQLERSDIYVKIQFNQNPWFQGVGYNGTVQAINGTCQSSYNGLPMKNFQCPWDPRSEYIDNYQGTAVALTGYLGVNGSDQYAQNGVFAPNHPASFGDITDGTSTTIMVGEKPPTLDLVYGWWYAGSGYAGTNLGTSDVLLGGFEKLTPNQADATNPNYFQPGLLNDPTNKHQYHFWSLHTGGAVFLFADGSAKMISYSIGRPIMSALCTMNGGEPVSLD